jgi:hypothetical protein
MTKGNLQDDLDGAMGNYCGCIPPFIVVGSEYILLTYSMVVIGFWNAMYFSSRDNTYLPAIALMGMDSCGGTFDKCNSTGFNITVVDGEVWRPICLDQRGGCRRLEVCNFPFEYGGTTYNECTTEGNDGSEWCYVEDIYATNEYAQTTTGSPNWAYCGDIDVDEEVTCDEATEAEGTEADAGGCEDNTPIEGSDAWTWSCTSNSDMNTCDGDSCCCDTGYQYDAAQEKCLKCPGAWLGDSIHPGACGNLV